MKFGQEKGTKNGQDTKEEVQEYGRYSKQVSSQESTWKEDGGGIGRTGER